MLIVRVELHSAITGQTTEIARMKIVNDRTGTEWRGNYVITTFHGRSKEMLDRKQMQRFGCVQNWPRKQRHVWELVAQSLLALKYKQLSAAALRRGQHARQD